MRNNDHEFGSDSPSSCPHLDNNGQPVRGYPLHSKSTMKIVILTRALQRNCSLLTELLRTFVNSIWPLLSFGKHVKSLVLMLSGREDAIVPNSPGL